MKKNVLTYRDYLKDKNVSKINEGFLDSILRFFKGLFDLFNNDKLKKKTESSSNYWNDIIEDDEIEDDEIEDAIDTKRVRNISSETTKIIIDKIEVDTEKGIRTTPDLIKSLTGWLVQILISQSQIIKMPVLQKIMKDPSASKRFVWVPEKYRDNGKTSKEWFSQKECILDKSIANSFINVIDSNNPNDIKDFSKKYIEFVAENFFKDGSKKLKENRPELLDDIFEGFSCMSIGMIETMNSIIKNTSDDKISEVIATELLKEKKTSSKKPKTKKDDEPEDLDSQQRSRKSSKRKLSSAN